MEDVRARQRGLGEGTKALRHEGAKGNAEKRIASGAHGREGRVRINRGGGRCLAATRSGASPTAWVAGKSFASLLAVLLILFLAPESKASDANKPKAAVFPLAGTASDEAREKVGFALRTKLNRDGAFDAIDGPTMLEIAAGPIALDAKVELLKQRVAEERPAVLLWGELNGEDVLTLKVKLLDLRQADAQVREIDQTIAEPTQLRFAVESILETIPGVKAFAHPNEQGITDDPAAAALWRKNPNLLKDGSFADGRSWSALFRSEKYAPEVGDALPEEDKVCICRLPGDKPGDAPHNVLAMRLSEAAAESNGLACISEAFKIEPKTRYRMSFRYRSDGPTLHVFVKGYYQTTGIAGDPAAIEDYRRQTTPSGPTDGKWVTVTDDLNPQNPDHPVETLRVDLYAYMHSGLVMFDDVIVRAVGVQTRHAEDDALRPASTQP